MGKKEEPEDDEVQEKKPDGPLVLQKKLLTAIEEHWRGVEDELISSHERKMGLTKQNFEKLLKDLSKKFETREPCVQVDEILECYKRAKERGYPTTRCEIFIDKFNECFNEFKEEKINKLASGRK